MKKYGSDYKIKLDSKEEANKFYKLIKALFILQTGLPHTYNFETKISEIGDLEFSFNSKIINYENLSKWIKDEYINYIPKIDELRIEEKNLKEKLDILKKDTIKKEEEYLFKQKQIATYLECKKTFLGKVKYYFKYGKKKSMCLCN